MGVVNTIFSNNGRKKERRRKRKKKREKITIERISELR